MNEVDKAMNEIELYEYEADHELAKWLREKADMMEFTEIAERLSI